MIKLNVKKLLKENGKSVSDMMHKTEMAPGTAYKLARKEFMANGESIQTSVIDRLCNYFGCGVGDIFEYLDENQS